MIAAERLMERREDHCPSCGAAFASSLGARRRKVQCPKCREVVTLKGDAPVAVVVVEPAPSAVSAELAELRALVNQLAGLPARVELLEQQLEWVMDHRPAAEASLLRPGQRLRWLRGAPVPWNGQGDPYSGQQGEILLHNIRALRSAVLTIRVAALDPRARRHGERLKEFFSQGGWLVNGIFEYPVTPSQHGLILLTGVCPPPPGFVAASMCLSAAACEVFCGFDAHLREDEVILTVATAAPSAPLL